MKLRVPHTFALLFGLVVVAAIATHWIPAGQFDRQEVDGRELVLPDSYHRVEGAPAGIAEIFLAYPRGLVETAYIVFYIFIIGGAFGVINATGAVEASIHGIVRACQGRGELIVAVLVVLFSIAGATIGMAEETLVFLPGLLILTRRLGYDDITAGAIGLVGAGAGFSGAFLNPFTVGVAQGIAGLPLFSGVGYRLLVWTVITAITAVFVVQYARRTRTQVDASGAEEEISSEVGGRQKAVLGLLLAALLAVVVGALRWQWGIMELSGLFIAVAVLAGLVGGLGASGTGDRFLEGAAAITGGALVVGLARGILVIFDGAGVTDTILHGMATSVSGLPASISVAGIYGVQVLLNFLVPSGSGQAALSIPILAPLGDLVGVTRQTTVLAYQFGDGFSNVVTPTQGYFMAGLALIGVRWERWVRFIWPLQLIWIATGLVFLLIAHAVQWGPF